jgi:hypothetical protein
VLGQDRQVPQQAVALRLLTVGQEVRIQESLRACNSVAYPGCSSRIPDPNFFHPGSRIRMKELKYFNPKNCTKHSENDPGCSSRILIFYLSRIPIQGVKKAPNPGSGSAILACTIIIILKGLSHEIDFKNFDKNLQNLAYLREAAGF